MTIGFVVGKFSPLHLGHKFLLETAQANCDRLVVFCYANPDFGYSAQDRGDAIARVVPNADIHVGYGAGIPPNNASEFDHRIHCALWLESLGYEPDIVFSSELYGEPFAAFLSGFFDKPVLHHMVDLHRVNFPISATKIRNGGHDEWIA
jgi:HTH-type transcriptional repressor of NAD biosynthesis genes